MLKKQRYHRVHTRHRLPPVRVVFADFHRLDMQTDEEYPEHRHAGYEAILVERGPYLCALNGVELRLEAGAVLVIKPGDRHADHLRNGQRHYVLHFSLEAGAGGRVPALFAPEVTPVQQVSRGNFAQDALLVGDIRREAEGGADYAAAVQDGMLAALFWRWVRGLAPEGLSREWRAMPGAEARREEIAALLGRHLAGNPTVAELAKEAGVSARQFTEQCRSLLGGPPAKLLLELKLREAEAMLRYQGRRVSEVSEALGFANPFHFSRVCRRAWGMPPSKLTKG
jgi:hypothetical protein